MKSGTILGVLILILFGSCATGSGSLFEAELNSSSRSASRSSASAESSDDQNQASSTDNENEDKENGEAETLSPGIHIHTSPSGSQIFLNGFPLGLSPLHIEPRRGTYQIRAEKSGYYSSTISLRYSPGDVHEIKLHLEQITGTLIVTGNVHNARLRTTGHVFSLNQEVELPIGRYTIEARAFGYETESFAVEILEKQTTRLELEMTPVPFRVISIEVPRRSFSPMDSGIYSRMTARVEVSAPGSAVYEILDSSGRRVHGPQSINFNQRQSSFSWTGLDRSGRRLPDGSYFMSFEAEDGSRFEQPIHIDSSVSMRYRSMFSTAAGTLLSPLPGHLPAFSVQAGFLVLSHRESAGSITPSSGSFRFSPSSGQEISAALSGVSFRPTGEDAQFQPSASIVLSQLLTGAANQPLSTALQLRASYRHEHGADFFVADSGAGLALPVSFSFGAFTLGLTPEIAMNGFNANSFWAYGRAALLADAGSITAAISTAVRTTPFGAGWAEGDIISWPLSSAAEIHWQIPETSLVLSAAGLLRQHPDDGWYMSAGGGLQVMFDGR
ncbi:PEGA domain-containing protein [Spirochaeta dissipatitropha]